MIWSWSAYDAYGICPRRYRDVMLLKKFKEPESSRTKALWGIKVHKAFEECVREGSSVPEELREQGLEAKIAALRAAPGEHFSEQRLALDRKLEPCDFWDNERVFVRGISDFTAVNEEKALALDYKTGKRKLTAQLKLMALLLFPHFPKLKTVHTGFMWLKFKGKIDQELYKREEQKKLWESFQERILQMRESEKLGLYPAKQGGLCKNYCPVQNCVYNGNYDPKLRRD